MFDVNAISWKVLPITYATTDSVLYCTVRLQWNWTQLGVAAEFGAAWE